MATSHLSSLSICLGAKPTMPIDGRLFKPKGTCPSVFFTFSSVQDGEHSAKHTQHHSPSVGRAGLAFWKPNRRGGVPQSEHRPRGTRHPRGLFSKHRSRFSKALLTRPLAWMVSGTVPSWPNRQVSNVRQAGPPAWVMLGKHGDGGSMGRFQPSSGCWL